MEENSPEIRKQEKLKINGSVVHLRSFWNCSTVHISEVLNLSFSS